MKKSMVSMFVLLAFVGFMGSVYAQKAPVAKVQAPKYEIVIAKVVSIDAVKNTFVAKVTKTAEDKTFSADAKIIAKLKVDENVKLYVTPGTDVVVKVSTLPKTHPIPATK
jgi:hypothetical protein